MPVIIDIIEGAGGSLTATSIELTRVAVVHGLAGSADQRAYNALTDPGLPIIGAAHPAFAAAKLREKSLLDIPSDTVVRVALIYRLNTTQSGGGGGGIIPAPVIQAGASAQQQPTIYDVSGAKLIVGFTGTPTLDDRVVTESVFRPQPSIVITRNEATNPIDLAEEYVGTVNQSGWSLRASAPARTWMCTGILGQSTDGGNTFDVTYSFLKRVNKNSGGVDKGWDSILVAIDPTTGRAPDGVTEGDGIEIYQVQIEKNFNLLGLP